MGGRVPNRDGGAEDGEIGMAKITIYGPRNDQFTSVGMDEKRFTLVDHPFNIEVETLAQALFAYADWYRSKVGNEGMKSRFVPAPHPPHAESWSVGDELRYFIFEEGNGDRSFVDVHVVRNGSEICAKQDSDMPLVDGDVVNIGILVC